MNYLVKKKNKKLVGKLEVETPKNIWIDEFVTLRSKNYASKGGDNTKNKSKGISKSQSKHIKFEEYKNCLYGK